MSEFSLFGDDDTKKPEPAKKRAPARRAPERKVRKPTAKQLRMQAPAPQNRVAEDDDTVRALRALDRFGMLAPEEKRRHEAALATEIPLPIATAIKEWRRNHGSDH